MRNLKIGLGVATLLLMVGAFQAGKAHGYVPPQGFVPDSSTAARIAEAVWIPIYGARVIAGERPYRVRLEKDVWIVEGALAIPNSVGGVALAEISKRDGRILRVTHGK